MNRRNFIKGSALAGMAGLVTLGVLAGETMTGKPSVMAEDNSKRQFKFKNGKFKILQLTDTHYIQGKPESVRALDNVNKVLDYEKPDLVIHTGDIIFGQPAEGSVREILQPIADRKIPFAVTFGNHDQEFGKTRHEMLEIVRTIPYNINRPKTDNIYGETNDFITLSDASGKVQRVLYLFDSMQSCKIPSLRSYDYIHPDQVMWYKGISDEFTKQNGGTPIPSISFFHIPLYEFRIATKDDEKVEIRGNKGEHVGSALFSGGLFITMKEQGDMQAMFNGHDHNSDYIAYWNEMFFIYGRYSGCDNVYNDLKPNGCRVIELTEGDSRFRSWIRLCDGTIEQNLLYPDDFMHRPKK